MHAPILGSAEGIAESTCIGLLHLDCLIMLC